MKEASSGGGRHEVSMGVHPRNGELQNACGAWGGHVGAGLTLCLKVVGPGQRALPTSWARGMPKGAPIPEHDLAILWLAPCMHRRPFIPTNST
jgi:hypothetical protein